MHVDREKALVHLAATQHQVVTRKQLHDDLGFSVAGIDRLLRAGRLVPLRRGVYALGGARPSWHGALYAAACGSPVSVVSHRGANGLWRLPGGAEIVEIASHRWHRQKGAELAGFPLVVHESLHLSERDVVELDGIWRTRVPRTLVDLGASVALGHLESATLTLAIQDAVRRNLTDVARLEAAFARLAPHIRIGARQFREALDRFQPALTLSESSPETQVGHALVCAGFTVIPQYELKLSPSWTVRIDFYLPELHRGVEVSPYYTHGGAVQREYDIVRELRILRVHGIEISTIGDDEVERGCQELIATLRTLPRVQLHKAS